jgi:hypothetical protein
MFVEKVVLILGPLLIGFASCIIYGLSWTFFTIVVPMMQRSYQLSPYGNIVIGCHIIFVAFLLMEIVFNYFMCVKTRNKGPSYEQVVREMAEATGFDYPETPQEVATFRRDFNDKMLLRMRRRQAREQELEAAAAVTSGLSSSSLGEEGGNAAAAALTVPTATPTTLDTPGGDASDTTMTQRKNRKKLAALPAAKKNPTPMQIRNWMLMAPDEWGFCARSNQPKPPRSHYDHVTKTLVLCLDHYCPWMFNAVGYFNYRYFCNFLWFVEIAMCYGVFMAYKPFVNASSLQYRKQVLEYRKTGVWKHLYEYTPINTERLPISLAFMLCLAVGIAVACLGGFHLYLTLTGQTTIEFHGNWMNRTKAKRLGQKWRNPYDLGWKRNLQQVYGTQPFPWAFLVPSTREPEFLPLPLMGEEGKRKSMRKKRDKVEIELGSEELSPLASTASIIDV